MKLKQIFSVKKEVTIMAKVTKDMLIGQLITLDPNIAPILMRAGMVHGMDVDVLVQQINDFLGE